MFGTGLWACYTLQYRYISSTSDHVMCYSSLLVSRRPLSEKGKTSQKSGGALES